MRNARAATGARDDAEAVDLALRSVVRGRHIDRLLGRLGKTDLNLSLEDLARLRSDA